MGMTALVVLLLLTLGCVAVQPRTRAVLYGVTGVLGALMAVLLVALMLGYLTWGWDSPVTH
jgi:hypothetical protein